VPKKYRTGAIGALLDEYERAIQDLSKVIETIPDPLLPQVLDPHTEDESCRSFQAILSHVVHSGYGYATRIHNLKGFPMVRPEKTFHRTIKEYLTDLVTLFSFTENVLLEWKDNELEQLDNALKIKTEWGQLYDVEQMMEHAIVHILRHRRQIEKFKALLNPQ
jgi:uncharacterized damage-inducible protein DinB